MEYVKNAWYPLTFASDVDRSLKRHMIMNEPVVLYRKENGDIVALEDLCPHRFTPLSIGRLKGDAVECGYHGMRFEGSGKCVRIPAQSNIPSKSAIRAYPIAESVGMVWIWLGSPELAKDEPVFDLPQFHDKENWSTLQGQALRIPANYLVYADNLTDPTHVSFVHPSTLGNSAYDDVPIQHHFEGKRLTVQRWIMNAPAMPLMAQFFTEVVDRWQIYNFYLPSVCIVDFGSAKAGAIDPQNGNRDLGLRAFACHFFTPVDEKNCIDHWMLIRNFGVKDSALNEHLRTQLTGAFIEDRDLLARVQEEMDRLGESRQPLRLAMDAGVIKMRRMIAKLIQDERDGGTHHDQIQGENAS